MFKASSPGTRAISTLPGISITGGRFILSPPGRRAAVLHRSPSAFPGLLATPRLDKRLLSPRHRLMERCHHRSAGTLGTESPLQVPASLTCTLHYKPSQYTLQ